MTVPLFFVFDILAEEGAGAGLFWPCPVCNRREGSMFGSAVAEEDIVLS